VFRILYLAALWLIAGLAFIFICQAVYCLLGSVDFLFALSAFSLGPKSTYIYFPAFLFSASTQSPSFISSSLFWA